MWSFHVVVLHRTAKKCTKMFLLIKPIVFAALPLPSPSSLAPKSNEGRSLTSAFVLPCLICFLSRFSFELNG